MTTFETSSETKTRNLTVFDLAGGGRLVGETVSGMGDHAVVNPTVLTIEKDPENEGQVRIAVNPVLFTKGSLYRLSPHSFVASYQCFDPTVHEIYGSAISKLLAEGTNANANTPKEE